MKPYRTGVKPHRRAAAKFIAEIHREVQKAYEEESVNGVNQSKIASILGVNRSVISRQLRGQSDMSSGRIAELAWVLGRKAKITLEKSPAPGDGCNVLEQQTIVRMENAPKVAVTNSTRMAVTAVVSEREGEIA